MGDHDFFDLLSVLANWFSAVGTVGAVIVALILAHRQNSARVQVTNGLVHVGPVGASVGDQPLNFRLGVVNAGLRDIVITGLQWRTGIVKRQRFVQLPQSLPGAPDLPARLAPGETADFLFPVEVFRRNAGPIGEALKNRRFARVRVGVYLTTGEDFLAPVDREVIKLFKS